MKSLRKKMILIAVMIIVIIALGTAGYEIVEGWSFLDALYMTITTLTTVGYREIHDLSVSGRVFTIFLIVTGVGTMLYSLSAGAQVVLEGQLNEFFGRKKLERKLKELRGHYIICGYGRMGRIIARELRAENERCVVIEKSPEVPADGPDMLILRGDASQDAVLTDAGIERAKGLISVLPSDAENLFVVLSARGLNPDLLIVARAVEEDSEQKLLRAGATRVVSPYHIGGLRMAHTVLRPSVVDFIEFATKGGNIELQMEEVNVQEGSPLIGQSLEECGGGRDLGVIIVAIKQATGETKFNPTSRNTVRSGDTLIALGERSRLKKIEEMARSSQAKI